MNSKIMNVLWLIDSISVVIALLRLGYLGFYRRYPALMTFLAVDLVSGCVGLYYGTGSISYYWVYFISNILVDSLLLILMCREMFAELYHNHAGLRALIKPTLKRSILVGACVTLGLAPVSVIHWGEADFQCWQFPFWEINRCLVFGAVVFVCTMWRKLRLVRLNFPRNVKTYAIGTCTYLTLVGLTQTMILVIHTEAATVLWSVTLLAASLGFYITLTVLAQRPRHLPQPSVASVDGVSANWLSSISDLLALADQAQRRGRSSTLRRHPFFFLGNRIHNVWKTSGRATSACRDLAQRE